jgi:hypothetical protein
MRRLARRRLKSPPGWLVVATVAVLLVLLAFPSGVLADGTSSQPDTGNLRAGMSAAGAATILGFLAGWWSNRGRSEPPPSDPPQPPPPTPPEKKMSRFPQNPAYDPSGINSRQDN